MNKTRVLLHGINMQNKNRHVGKYRVISAGGKIVTKPKSISLGTLRSNVVSPGAISSAGYVSSDNDLSVLLNETKKKSDLFLKRARERC